jgi:hypothetical protein
VVQFQEVWVQNCLVTSCHFQASSHLCNQNTFNLQNWLTFIACWSLIKIFCQNKMLNICWFQNNKETKNKTCFVEGWDVIPKQNAKFHNNMIDNSSSFLNQLLWQYMCFAKQFRTLVTLRMFHDNMTNDNLLHRFNSPFAHQLPDSILAIVQLNDLKSRHDIQISCLDYIT